MPLIPALEMLQAEECLLASKSYETLLREGWGEEKKVGKRKGKNGRGRQLGMVVHIFSPSTQEADTDRSL